MRLFVALWPSPEVIDVLAALARPDEPAVRWTSPDQWHVTLRFLGDVAEADLPAVAEALGAAGRLPPRPARAGPATCRLGRFVLVVPVRGIDDLGAAATAATRPFGAPPDDRPFTGHLTLARGRGRSTVPPRLGGEAVDVSWHVRELALVRSHLSSKGARYETLATVPLTL